MDVAEFVNALPKAELHLHLEGALPWAMTRAHSPHPLPDTPEWWADEFRFENFDFFKQAIALCYKHILTGLDRYRQAAGTVFDGLAGQNVRYVEISFSVDWATAQELAINDVAAAIKRAAPSSMAVRVFGGLSREEPPTNNSLLDAVLGAANLDGLDLHGDETVQGPAPFADIFAQARQNGLMTKAHAGELVGPRSVADTLDLLRVTRIEHGTTAVHDAALMARLADEAITLDMCPWSNVRLRVVNRLADHPILEFHRRGIPVTINTDDPTLFGTSLTHELLSLVSQLRFSLADLAAVQANAFRAAAIPAATRAGLLAEIDDLLAAANHR
ncbi:MAG: adenosine deaminase [Anaerolineae bacterium]